MTKNINFILELWENLVYLRKSKNGVAFWR